MISYTMLSKVISGGQTGADIAGFIAAKKCDIHLLIHS